MPTTISPGPKLSTNTLHSANSETGAAAFSFSSGIVPTTTINLSPWIPIRTSAEFRLAFRLRASTSVESSKPPIITVTAPLARQPSADMREESSSSLSPLSMVSTTKASSLASQSPLASAALA